MNPSKCQSPFAHPSPWWDWNYDGTFSISDIWPIAMWVFHIPGDLAVKLIVENWAIAAGLLELNCGSYGGAFSVIVSVVVWLIVFSVVGAT